MRAQGRISLSTSYPARVSTCVITSTEMPRPGSALPENGGEALWEVWGTYEHGFEKTEDGWRVNSMTFTATAERGSEFVRNTPGS